MGRDGGRAPTPYTQRHASTLFLRVPALDWPRVKIGEKTEFRTLPRESSRVALAKCPTLVVAYERTGLGHYDAQTMVLEEHRYEPLFAISDDAEGIGREGFDSYDHFRRYWRARRHGVYRPMEKVHVWRLRPLRGGDVEFFGARLVDHLYGDWL